ncbi:MAG: bifunctional (p)ppGpp synthetase/guanosine-3',5'-bis(diphosphate) 3'-pyrophosphohydrolase [Bacteroides sp.]|nr:bifunctional (p)ppGpp synthetase/guanosine-3',5'-bis(diphosphate) 3'-pyrophosphohydrolase [Bacteroides sp.]
MKEDYDKIIEERAEHVFEVMKSHASDADMLRLRDAFALAREAHAPQVRKTGEPYILHPIAVASICAEELHLDVNSVIAAFLHDVVEDTPHPLGEIKTRFGDDVAFLVNVLTKKEKKNYDMSKQVDNFRQILNSMEKDIRPIMVKLADRLHNMRTLSSMRPDKQMKIAGETDYFYAPLANRLGLYHVKTELENLSFRFRCPHEYEEISTLIANDREQQKERLERFRSQIEATLAEAGIFTCVAVEYREPYSIWRKMKKFGDDFNHLKYRHFTDVIFKTPEGADEKAIALKVYSILTDVFSEKPGGISNYIDSPKENGYQSFHVKLLADFGRWQEVHISSERMVCNSRLGYRAGLTQDYITRWVDKFRGVLRDIGSHEVGIDFMEKVTASFYNDDIKVFTPHGQQIMLPQKASVLDFAYEISKELGDHAKYARINGFLSPVSASLNRGDVVEIFTDENVYPKEVWLDKVVTYKAKNAIKQYLQSLPVPKFHRCDHCRPIPGEEVIGFNGKDDMLTIHKRDCPVVIRLASQFGDDIVSVDFEADETLYTVKVTVRAIDRPHLFLDIVDCISNKLALNIDSYNTDTTDSLVTVEMQFGVHSYSELQKIMTHIAGIPDVDEVKWKVK